ncbi:hypothetical protein GCM10010219_64390 [Streptomyces netropsis]|nr:hypothetical protein GCM10010219_64390 [Streptomyces netropsis]
MVAGLGHARGSPFAGHALRDRGSRGAVHLRLFEAWLVVGAPVGAAGEIGGSGGASASRAGRRVGTGVISSGTPRTRPSSSALWAGYGAAFAASCGRWPTDGPHDGRALWDPGQCTLRPAAFACHSRPMERMSAGYTPTYRKGLMAAM